MRPTIRRLAGGHALPPWSERPPGAFYAPRIPIGYRIGGKALGATMFFWIFYRAYTDRGAMMGFVLPWEGHEEHHGSDDDHSHH